MQYNSEHNYFYAVIAGGGGEIRVSENVPGVSFNYDSFDRGSPLYHLELARVGTSNVYAFYLGSEQSVRFVYGGSQSVTHTDTAPKAVKDDDGNVIKDTYAKKEEIPAPYTPPPYLRVYDEVRQCWWIGKMVNGVINWEVE